MAGQPCVSRTRTSAKLADVIVGRNQASADAQAQHLADVALAANFDDLLEAAKIAEQDFRAAQAAARPLDEQYPLAKKLDAALTDAMRAAYASLERTLGIVSPGSSRIAFALPGSRLSIASTSRFVSGDRARPTLAAFLSVAISASTIVTGISHTPCEPKWRSEGRRAGRTDSALSIMSRPRFSQPGRRSRRA